MATTSDMKVIHFAPLEPDVIVSEIWAPEDRIAVEMIWGRDGSRLIHLASGDGVDLDAGAFLALLTEEAAHLDDWSANLRAAGGVWEDESMTESKA
jgi:hypothetical protein